ncbi:cell wall-binding repeat-containing protein [Laceyella putida]|uniref:Cell wall-binding repeat-containing protein n=1 Tax=Laceyella putida TaxID=110101 RepID=A0ABW2RJL5_9BACL
MRNILILLSALLALLPFSFLPNSAHASKDVIQAAKKTTTDDFKMKKFHRIMAMKQETKQKQQKKSNGESRSPLAADEVTTTSVNYKGQASNTRQDEYVFQVASSSQVQITANHTSTKIDYLLVGMDASGNLSFYQSGDTLPAGDYSFMVFVDNTSALSYDYVISGVQFASEPDLRVPAITFTSPTFPVSRLPQNTSSLLFSGTTDTETELVSNETFTQSFIGDFNFSVPLHPGNNYVDMQSVTATGNATYINLDLVVPALKRLDGYSRYDVAANVSKEMPPSDTVIITSGGDGKFADALSGGSLAGLNQAPVLLTAQTSLPTATVSEIQRRQPSRAIIMGGVGTVDTAVETQLKELGVTTIQRIDGANRFAVSANAASELTRILGAETKDTAIIASGLDFPDALSASSLTSDALIPTLLINPNSTSLPAEIDAFLKSHTRIKNFIIVGGVGSVPDAIATKLDALGDVKRIDGADRYAVNLNLIKEFGMDLRFMVFAKGTDYPDALAGGPFAGSLAPTLSPLVLTPTSSLYANLKTYLDANQKNIQVIYLLGDESSISANVATQLNTYVD